MNCLEFRRQLAVDPQSTAAEFLRHRQECARCAQSYARAQSFEAALGLALAVEVPAQLAEHILLRQTTLARKDRSEWRTTWFKRISAIAAVLVVGVALSWVAWFSVQPLADHAVWHMEFESHAFDFDAVLPEPVVRREFAREGIRLYGAPATVSYVNNCPLGTNRGMHMISSEGGKAVTVFFAPDVREAERSDFTRKHWRGRSVPMGTGTLIMVAEDDSRFDALEGTWRAALEGDASNQVADL